MGKINVNVSTTHLSRYPEEKPIVDRFKALFDITRADRVRFENSNASTYFLKPTEETTRLYGLTKELLLFYSPYPSLEARTFQHVEEAISQRKAVGRLERVCFVLVAPNANIHEQVAKVQDQKAQAALPIPFTMEELKWNDDPRLLHSRFSEKLFSRDLFDMEQALVDDSYFFGRQTFVFELRDRYRKGENTGLYGLRKSGKTSAIFKLRRLIETDKEECLLYLDAQTPELYTLRWWELLDLIKARLASEIGISLPHPLDKAFTQTTAVKRFRIAIDTIFSLAGKRLKRVLLVFDEIEHICPEMSPVTHWNEDFLPFWKLLRSVQTSDRRLTFLIVGVNAWASERTSVAGHDNPLFSLVGSRYIPSFEKGETRTMVQTLGGYMGMGFTPDACEYLALHYGGHPLLIRLACSWEHNRLLSRAQNRPVQLTRADLVSRESTRDEDKVQYVKHIVEVLRIWYREEYDLLLLLASGEVEEFREYADTLPTSVQHLRAYNLIREPGPQISISMVQHFFKLIAHEKKVNRGSSDFTPAIGTDAWLTLLQDSGNLRNRLEPRLRQFIKTILVAHYGPEKWITAVLAALPSERREKLHHVDRDEILNSKLFMTDLLQVIEQNWEKFKHLEQVDSGKKVSRASIKVLVDFVNAGRVDAHAKPTDRENLAATALACKALEEAIEPYLR